MSSERPDGAPQLPTSGQQQTSDRSGSSASSASRAADNDDTRQPATVLVRGETVRNQDPKSPPKDSQTNDKEKSPKEVLPAKIKMQSRLPALDDDPDVGIQKDHVVTRDDEADLAFTGTLLASAAPPLAPKGKWQEYRVYETNGGKHVFSKVTRTVFVDEQDEYEAQVFDPAPSSMPSQLLRSARELTRSHPLTWTDAAAAFFGYDPLAKALYRKLGGQFDERIS